MKTYAYALTLALAASLSFTSLASAQAGQGAIRLGADVGVIGLQHFPNDDLPDPPDPSFQFGLWGTDLYRPQVGASIAFQVLEPLIIGARAGFGVLVVDTGPFGSNVTGLFSLVPFVEYMFLEGSIRPFIGGQIGFQAIFPEDADAQAWFIGGPLGGVHIFATESFSISPTLMIDFLYRGDAERAGYGISGIVSFQGWIGGSGSSGYQAPPPSTTADTFP